MGRPARPSPPTGASGCATARRNPVALNTSRCASPPSPPNWFIASRLEWGRPPGLRGSSRTRFRRLQGETPHQLIVDDIHRRLSTIYVCPTDASAESDVHPVIEAIPGYVTHRRWAKLDLRCPHSSPRRAEIGVSRKSLLPSTMPGRPRGVMPGIKSLWRCGWDETASGLFGRCGWDETASGLFGTPTGPRGAQNGNSG